MPPLLLPPVALRCDCRMMSKLSARRSPATPPSAPPPRPARPPAVAAAEAPPILLEREQPPRLMRGGTCINCTDAASMAVMYADSAASMA